MKRKINISGLKHTDPISEEDKHDSNTINIKNEEIIPWNTPTLFKDLPNEHGVYVIYDYSDTVIYVGKTWDENGFNRPFYKHMTDSDGRFPYWQYTAKNIRLYYISKWLEMLTLERLKIQQHEPPFNKEDVGPGPSMGQRKKIKEELQGQLDVIKDMYYNSPTVDDEFLKLLLITAGFHKVEEWIMQEAYSPGYLDNKLDEIAELLKEPRDLPTKSGGYLSGLRELIN